MTLRSKPGASKDLPPEVVEWAKSADASSEETKKEIQKPVEKKPDVPETKAQVSFRLAPTVQWRIKSLAMKLSSPGTRVTSQDLMERAILKFLAENETAGE